MGYRHFIIRVHVCMHVCVPLPHLYCPYLMTKLACCPMQKDFAPAPLVPMMFCHMMHPPLSCPQVMLFKCFVLGFECAPHFL